MNSRVIGFPANPSVDDEHQGWVWDGDKWVSTAVDGGGSIQDGDTQGQITTWDTASGEWTPDGAVVVDGDNVGIGTSSPAVKLTLEDDGNSLMFRGKTIGTSTFLGYSPDGAGGNDFMVNNQVGGLKLFTALDSGGPIIMETNATERMRIDASGNVGIGETNPDEALHVSSGRGGFVLERDGTSYDGKFRFMVGGDAGGGFKIADMTTGSTQNRLTINASGNVGIGGQAGTRTAGEYLEQAKTQLAGWKAEVKKRTAEQPDASTQEITLEVTDGDFGVFPTAEALAEKMAERAIGGGDAKLQVAGDGYFGGTLFAVQSVHKNYSGIYYGETALLPLDGNASYVNDAISLGDTNYRFKDAYLSGTVNANKFVGDGSGLTGISGGMPSGDYTHNGKITATDFISTSDERLKDNITPIPVGLIDDIKPVSWEWKDGSGTSAGVVAQQLQSAGLGDYVHENEDGQLGVNYQALTAILLAEVINLKAEVEALK